MHRSICALRVLRPVEREAVLDQPFRQVDASNGADCYGAPVSVTVNFNALDRAVGNEGIKIVRGLLPAAILFAVVIPAKLIGFRCVNSPKANTLAMNFYCVAVDHCGLAGKVGGGGGRGEHHGSNEDRPPQKMR
jgi:hypothetical protein